ncbi:heterokaryon incompatibility protein-domain-containing protein [Hypoxylon crocopeplum]|nr:heterokaryon incompatibility protein-domain-containing protein [Hypoxylon crocopeplum]
MANDVYDELPQAPGRRYIRLCELQLGSGADPLQIRLLPTELHKHTTAAYEAISWVWGSPVNSTTINYKGVELAIRQNLDDAMRALRLPDRKRTIWADALCINQGDSDEKGDQVAMMGLIYSCASTVLIWLGHDHERMAADAFKEIDHHVVSRRLTKAVAEWRVVSEEEVDLLNVKTWNSIGSFFRNEWFSRVWIQQELGVTRSAAFFWGSSQIASDIVAAFYQWVAWNDYSGSSMVKKLLRDSLYAAGSTFGLAATFRNTSGHTSASSSFMQLLDYSQNLLATDPRDYVYGFLSHPSARNMSTSADQITYWDIMDNSAPLVTPDYKKSIDEVYRDIVLALMRHHTELEPLTLVFHNESTLASDAPS